MELVNIIVAVCVLSVSLVSGDVNDVAADESTATEVYSNRYPLIANSFLNLNTI